MRKFRTTAAIFVFGVVASKLFAGAYEPPIFNRWAGEIKRDNWLYGEKTGANIQFEIFQQMYGGNEIRFVEFEFFGKPETLEALGLPASKVRCDIYKSVPIKGGNRHVHFELSGDSPLCTGLKVRPTLAMEMVTVEFQGKDMVLHAKVERNNSRGLIVGGMQSYRAVSWTHSKGAI